MTKHHQRNGGQGPKSTRKLAMRVAAFLLCLSMVAGLFPGLAQAAEDKYLFDNIATLESAALYDDAGAQIQNSALIEQRKRLELRYTYTIDDTRCADILPDVAYYLRISPHLQLPTSMSSRGDPPAHGSGDRHRGDRAGALWCAPCGRPTRLGDIPSL